MRQTKHRYVVWIRVLVRELCLMYSFGTYQRCLLLIHGVCSLRVPNHTAPESFLYQAAPFTNVCG